MRQITDDMLGQATHDHHGSCDRPWKDHSTQEQAAWIAAGRAAAGIAGEHVAWRAIHALMDLAVTSDHVDAKEATQRIALSTMGHRLSADDLSRLSTEAAARTAGSHRKV